MLLATFLAAALASAVPSPGDAYAAIYNDVQLNAWIGNGNEEVTLEWVVGLDQSATPELHIADLRCKPSRRRSSCTFNLIRTPASNASPHDRSLATLLSCRADLEWAKVGDGAWAWKVVHNPPRRRSSSHSQTTMTCRS